ncbi:Transmembrane protein [Trema orientale]|uniref:Transmembrane protein n=1 Tax=Trema orientale TaxID=63057 RepID=A0A2P5FPN8_TREOI|nr:Transmembrane protein [Trema orientale]
MENRLFEAALTGNVETLHKLREENPLILSDYSLISPHENPLHVATKAGKLGFVKEMIRLKPESVMELNKEGFRPLDIASALGHVEIVKEIIASTSCTTTTSGNDICRLKGKDGRTAMHYAVIHGKIEVIDELVSFSVECVKDLTVLGETTLHLAVKYYRFEALRSLVESLEKLGLEELVNWGDKDGNTVLHLAVSRKQHESVEFLLNNNSISSALKLNETNSRGLTPMDVMDLLIETPSDVQLRQTLRLAGAVGAGDNITNAMPTTPANNSSLPQHIAVNYVPNNQPPEPGAVETDWMKYFRYQQKRDSPSDTRNALLVVAALIATVTFQAGVDPPGGFREPQSGNSTNISPASQPPTPPHSPTTIGIAAIFAALGGVATSDWFLLGNSLGFATSVSIIIYLTAGFPFQRELHIAIYSIMFAYGWSVSDIQPKEGARYTILGIAFLVPFLVRWFPRWARKLWRLYRKSS